jgi:hypothetical protein
MVFVFVVPHLKQIHIFRIFSKIYVPLFFDRYFLRSSFFKASFKHFFRVDQLRLWKHLQFHKTVFMVGTLNKTIFIFFYRFSEPMIFINYFYALLNFSQITTRCVTNFEIF